MSGHQDRLTTPRVTFPKPSLSKTQRRLFKLMHPFAAYETWKGARLLDTCKTDWINRVVINTMVLSDRDECILKQVFGSYDEGLCQLQILEPASYGFDCRPQMDLFYRKAWAIQIQNRH